VAEVDLGAGKMLGVVITSMLIGGGGSYLASTRTNEVQLAGVAVRLQNMDNAIGEARKDIDVNRERWEILSRTVENHTSEFSQIYRIGSERAAQMEEIRTEIRALHDVDSRRDVQLSEMQGDLRRLIESRAEATKANQEGFAALAAQIRDWRRSGEGRDDGRPAH
jgi:chromosome segregation ATPase